MLLEYVITQSFLQIIAVQQEFVVSYDGFISEVWIGSKHNDVALDKFGKWNMLSNGRSNDDEDHSDERKAVDAHSRLLNQIKTATRPFQRPILNFHIPTEIHIRAALYQTFDLDQRNNVATISGYFHLWWIDPSLRWNASEFHNITRTFIPSKWFWKPELYLYHSIEGKILDYAPDAMAEISASGRLRISIPITARALCPINVKHFPFDIQNCTFALRMTHIRFAYLAHKKGWQQMNLLTKNRLQCGSWSYQYEYVSLIVDQQEVFLDDFYDSQEWLLENATIHNGTMESLEHESFSTIYMILILRRQSFYHIFNFVFPTTLEVVYIKRISSYDHNGATWLALVSLLAIIGFHSPINATGRHESKFRLGIMALISMSVILLMLVDEMKVALESIPGQKGSFRDVPLLAVFHMIQMLIISIATCTSSTFVYLEKYALRNQYVEAIPWWLRFLSAKRLFCCYLPKKFQIAGSEDIKRNHDVTTRFVNSTSDSFTFRDVIPIEAKIDSTVDKDLGTGRHNVISNLVNVTECHQETAISEVIADAPPPINTQRIELLVNLMREFIQMKEEGQRRRCLPTYWKRVIRRLENISLAVYLFLVITNVAMFMCHEFWY
ncbi:Neuronal acetylcholine receptor subunit beta-4 [Dirofilaria immitis]|nr:Neuronal acetylcholine receptor subunit beta-4 [Dirofilaria immitis]